MVIIPKTFCYVNTLQSSLCGFNKLCESSLVGNCELCKHFTVEGDTALLKTVHETRVVDTFNFALCGNSGDLQSAEISLLLLSANVSVVTALENGLLSHLKMLTFCAPKALSEL